MDDKKALAKAMLLCSRKEYCVLEIASKLKKWEIKETKIDEIIVALKKEKFIDENRYAEFFVHDKIWINKWGKRKVAYQLRLKKIPEKIIATSLNKIESGKYENLIYSELIKKMKNINTKEVLKIKSKLLNFGLNRGYESEIVYRFIDKIA
ncbi:MAG: RecX family transcriptional regulator [Chlorobi bacterium]|nr:RecX family transcriptional regulator [Chlorobiota bacterium]